MGYRYVWLIFLFFNIRFRPRFYLLNEYSPAIILRVHFYVRFVDFYAPVTYFNVRIAVFNSKIVDSYIKIIDPYIKIIDSHAKIIELDFKIIDFGYNFTILAKKMANFDIKNPPGIKKPAFTAV